VVDPSINGEMMEMYADANSRGGILEPAGICDVKFRTPDLLKLMQRNDKALQEMTASLNEANDPAMVAATQAQIEARQAQLLPFYLQVALEFADLHDRPGRMKAKGVIRDVVDWADSRTYFYWCARIRAGARAPLRTRARIRAQQAQSGTPSVRDACARESAEIAPRCSPALPPLPLCFLCAWVRVSLRRLKRRLAELKVQKAATAMSGRQVLRSEVGAPAHARARALARALERARTRTLAASASARNPRELVRCRI
jgi:hypothetical protein